MAEVSVSVEYRDVPGWPGYRVGTDGSVWHCWSRYRHGPRRMTDRWQQMKPSIQKKRNKGRAYRYLNLVPPEGGSYKTFRVHRLILETFVGPCPPGMEARHLNGDPGDNRLENLAWGSPERNRQDNRELGAYQRGEGHSQATLTEADVREIRRLYATGEYLQKELAARFGVQVPAVSMIVNRRSWKHVV
jgi:hypothetical protein